MRSDRFVMQQAGEADSAEILSVLEENPLPGPISLIYTRRPDAYRSFMAEGRETFLFICRDTQEGRIAGLGAGAIHECLVGRRPEKMVYLFGLRIRQEYLAKRVLVMLPGAYRSLVEHFQSQGVRHFLTVVLADNLPALRLLTRERSRMPRCTFLCPYHTMVFLTRRRAPSLPSPLAFRRATSTDRSTIQDFLSTEGGHCDFFPSGPGGLFDPPEGLSWESFRLLTDRQGRILACGAVWDQTAHKQYIVAGYNGALRWLHLVSPLLRLLGYPPMPRPSSIVPFFALAFWCVRENRPEHLKRFLDCLAYEARDYPYFVTGVPEAHPLGPALNRWKFLGYDSHIYMVGDHVAPEDAARLGKSPYLECGWL
jgi:hypothetical protein